MKAIGDISIHVAQRPYAHALSFGADRLGWRALDALQRRIGEKLRQAGAKHSVALVLPHSMALAVIFLSAARLGLEVQILDAAWPRSISEEILRRLDPDLVIRPEDLSASLDVSALQAWCAETRPIDEWPSVDPYASFYAGFTSGTTGLPKGYRRHHQSWLASFKAARTAFPLHEADVVAAPGTLTHSLFLFALAYAMNEGSHCVMARSFRPDHCLEMMERCGASMLFSVPVQLGLLARQEHRKAIPTLRQIVSSGSKLHDNERAALASRFPNALLTEFYGTSETSFISFRNVRGQETEGCVGAPFAGVDVSIRDEHGAETPRGQTGRIHVRSDMLFSGYACGADISPASMDGFIATEDRGFLDPSGRLFLAGRQGRMIVTSAKNMFPEEIERILESIKGIHRAVVIGVPDAHRGEKPVAFVEREAGSGVDRVHIATALRQSLAAFKIPRDICFVTTWPLTRSGKIDYAALKDLWPVLSREQK